MSFTFPKPEAVCLDLSANDREGLINAMISSIENCPDVVDFETFRRQLLKREMMTPSALGNGCALPHVRTPAVEEIILVVGRSLEPIDFGAQDGPARLFFLFGVPEHCITQYLKLVARLSALLKREDFRQQLLEASTEDSVLKILEEARK
jgi:fructose PTS system EIIBC or EIIC component